MHRRWQKIVALMIFAIIFAIGRAGMFPERDTVVIAQATATPTPAPAFDQAAAIAKLKEQINGREQQLAETVFRNIQTPMLKGSPASRVLAVMEFGFARSLGVDCTHCHVAGKWDSDEKPEKQIARDMTAMMARINGELLKNIKNLKSATPTVNCTTCHRGQVKPALNLPVQK